MLGLAQRAARREPSVIDIPEEFAPKPGIPQPEPSPLEAEPTAQFPTAQRDQASPPASLFESLVSLLPDYDGGSELTQLFDDELHHQLRRELDALNRTWKVSPRPFESDVAVLGPLIIAFRDLANNLSTRWYVQSLLDQQVAFNAHVTRLLNAQATQFEARVRQSVESLHNLALQYSRLFGRIAQVAEQHDVSLENLDVELWLQSQQIFDQGQSTSFLAGQIARLHRQLLELQTRMSQLEERLDG
jgi:hypothetical protein